VEEIETEDARPFPDSLCHRCAAPPRIIRTERSAFIHCPILKAYPPQPVRACKEFLPLSEHEGEAPGVRGR
jgi:hypothetical protein